MVDDPPCELLDRPVEDLRIVCRVPGVRPRSDCVSIQLARESGTLQAVSHSGGGFAVEGVAVDIYTVLVLSMSRVHTC